MPLSESQEDLGLLFMHSWISVAACLPDSDMTVLINTPRSSEPVWLGFFDGECWRNIEGFPIAVTHWADMPEPLQLQPLQEIE